MSDPDTDKIPRPPRIEMTPGTDAPAFIIPLIRDDDDPFQINAFHEWYAERAREFSKVKAGLTIMARNWPVAPGPSGVKEGFK